MGRRRFEVSITQVTEDLTCGSSSAAEVGIREIDRVPCPCKDLTPNRTLSIRISSRLKILGPTETGEETPYHRGKSGVMSGLSGNHPDFNRWTPHPRVERRPTDPVATPPPSGQR